MSLSRSVSYRGNVNTLQSIRQNQICMSAIGHWFKYGARYLYRSIVRRHKSLKDDSFWL